MQRIPLLALLSLSISPLATVNGQTTLPPASQRFLKLNGEEIPSFQRHVIPLMGRLGCNGRACHGSFQGQGGFRLSLFGYDFEADHAALLKGDAPRADVKRPERSLILEKPTLKIPHKGGKRFEPGSWEYHLIHRWIAAGGVGVKEADADFDSLTVEPGEILFNKQGQTQSLKVIVKWSDGSREDVTPLCRFRSNDESVATVDDAGKVKCVGKGGTDIVAFYDNGVVPIQVIMPISDLVGDRYPDVPTPTKVDEITVAQLRKLGIVPSELCSDVEFLRRVSLDMTGTLPTSTEVLAFLADKSANKRSRKIEELLSRPTYAAYWATRLGDWTGNSGSTGPLGGERMLNNARSRQWYEWLYQRIDKNVPYDKLVEGIVLAVSREPEQDFKDYCKKLGTYFRKDDPAHFGDEKYMPYFWIRRTVGRPEAKALAFSHAFLGVSLQCAQCHKHPYDQWTKQDFDQFSDFFYSMSYRHADRKLVSKMKLDVGLTGDQDSGTYGRKFLKLAQQGTLLPFQELRIPRPTKSKRPRKRKTPSGRVITPKLLGGNEVLTNEYNDPRQPLMDWMRQSENPYFARAFVNRVWACYFNVGLINPTDDLNLANPPSNPALLDYLATEFVQQGYDMKWLHCTITNCRTYQLSWRPTKTNKKDERFFSHSIIRRLPAEVVYDALVHATASDETLKQLRKDPVSARAIGYSSGLSGRKADAYAVKLFGQPSRQINCDCERSNEPSLLQTVYLRNDQEVAKMLDRKDGWLKQMAGMKATKPEELVRQAYLRVLSRLPGEREAEISLRYLRESKTTVSGLRDLMWALVNTKEFVVNR